VSEKSASLDHSDTGVSDSTPTFSDRQLLHRVAAGDENAFADLYQRYGTPLYNYLVHLVHEPPVAEDLLQETFVGAWRNARRFRGQSKVATWLYRIAHNRAVSWLRGHKQMSRLDEMWDLAVDGDPSQHVMDKWRATQVRRALDQLSHKHRAVLELTFVHGFSYGEIAKIIGCPEGTVKSRMSYARRYLSEALRDMDVGDLGE
jgi:RNA polymerase sigma-70 factor (ECF subfamily)